MTILQVRQLSFSYGEVQVLKNVSMQIREGERVGLVGANRSGKSTLLRLLESEWSRTSRIARALSQTADALLLDEPTDYLDGKFAGSREVQA